MPTFHNAGRTSVFDEVSGFRRLWALKNLSHVGNNAHVSNTLSCSLFSLDLIRVVRFPTSILKETPLSALNMANTART